MPGPNHAQQDASGASSQRQPATTHTVFEEPQAVALQQRQHQLLFAVWMDGEDKVLVCWPGWLICLQCRMESEKGCCMHARDSASLHLLLLSHQSHGVLLTFSTSWVVKTWSSHFSLTLRSPTVQSWLWSPAARTTVTLMPAVCCLHVTKPTCWLSLCSMQCLGRSAHNQHGHDVCAAFARQCKSQVGHLDATQW